MTFAWRSRGVRVAFAFAFRLPCRGPLHRVGQVHVFDLNRRDLDAPGVGLLINHFLQAVVDLIAFRESICSTACMGSVTWK
jgi:hypothetical protein